MNTMNVGVPFDPKSQARIWRKQHLKDKNIAWIDPYEGLGGLGASSAQFIGSYLAACFVQEKKPQIHEMLDAYYACAWSGEGLRPSGYDVVAQIHYGCVYMNRTKQKLYCHAWPFAEISFLLVHTGTKLATHHHLQKTTLPQEISVLSALVDQAHEALRLRNSDVFIKCINDYHYHLEQMNLVANHSLQLINEYRTYPEVLAIKGCGALGSDVLLMITYTDNLDVLQQRLYKNKGTILATEKKLANANELFQLFN
jgi:homoserine kinase